MKIGLCIISLNSAYWPFTKDVIESARKHFMKKHEVDYLLWTDMPPETNYGAKVFPTEAVQGNLPTLLRYHIMLRNEDMLKRYDYLFYVDVDMLFVSEVGDEILGEGLTAALHPMYSLRKEYLFPYEPNPESTAYIPAPRYYAGGFQGGKTRDFIKAMWTMRRMIDEDFNRNYTARWNDESHWNRLLYDNPPSVVLSQAYIYPDSLIETYYKKIWGQDFEPKIITLTKRFSTSKEGGTLLKNLVENI